MWSCVALFIGKQQMPSPTLLILVDAIWCTTGKWLVTWQPPLPQQLQSDQPRAATLLNTRSCSIWFFWRQTLATQKDAALLEKKQGLNLSKCATRILEQLCTQAGLWKTCSRWESNGNLSTKALQGVGAKGRMCYLFHFWSPRGECAAWFTSDSCQQKLASSFPFQPLKWILVLTRRGAAVIVSLCKDWRRMVLSLWCSLCLKIVSNKLVSNEHLKLHF